MLPENDQPYAVGQLSEVLRRLHDLTEKAKMLGMGRELAEAITTVVGKLAAEPASYGDPEYHPNKPGSCVYHAICDPLYVRYVVYEVERVVLILEIRPLPHSPLA